MAIATLDQYIAAAKQKINITKTTSRVSVAVIPFSCFDVAGSPGAGVLAGTSTTVPVKPNDATAGCPFINFTTGVGYLSRLNYRSSVAGMIDVYDMLSKSGAYSYAAATTTITSVLDISSRCPDYTGGVNYGLGNEIWIEVVVAFVTGTAWQVQVTYNNQAGNLSTSIISVAQAAAALTLGKMFQIALAVGDSGVQAIKSVIVTNGGTAMTAGTFNVLILRPLAGNLRVAVPGGGDSYDMLRTGLPVVYADSALIAVPTPDSTATGIWNVTLEIASA